MHARNAFLLLLEGSYKYLSTFSFYPVPFMRWFCIASIFDLQSGATAPRRVGTNTDTRKIIFLVSIFWVFKILYFTNFNNFFFNPDIEITNMMFHCYNFLFLVLKIWSITRITTWVDCVNHKSGLTMLYIYKTDTTHADLMSSQV